LFKIDWDSRCRHDHYACIRTVGARELYFDPTLYCERGPETETTRDLFMQMRRDREPTRALNINHWAKGAVPHPIFTNSVLAV